MTSLIRRVNATVATVAIAAVVVADASTKDARLMVGKPAVWTLEQAHYLLARQRHTNLDLQTKALKGDDLDPNAINSSKLDALRMLFSAEASFDQGRGLENNTTVDRRSEMRTQQAELNRRLSGYRGQQTALVREIGDRQVEAAAFDPETQKADLAVKNAEVAAKQAQLKLVEQRITETSALLANVETALNAPLTLKPFIPTGTSTLPESSVQKAIEKALDTGPARLHASAALDNYIQMQYELIAKQLSLLRDDVGTENRLVFLELPVSVYTSPKAENVLVQTTWKVEALIRCKQPGDKTEVDATVANWDSFKRVYENACGVNDEGTPVQRTTIQGRQASFSMLLEQVEKSEKSSDYKRVLERQQEARSRQTVSDSQRSNNPSRLPPPPPPPLDKAPVPSKFVAVRAASSDLAHVIDLFPRQSALNVNTVHDRVSRFNLSGVLSLVGGFGAKTQFERQHELFENYIEQDIFAAGFGKGDTTFGWTFGPLPGSRQVASGVKVTYAAVVIPKDVQALSIRGSACPLQRTKMPSADPFVPEPGRTSCVVSERFDLTLPFATEGFTPNRVAYTTVGPSQTATMFIHGDYFSPQLGVLVDGSPLKARALGLAQTELDSTLAVPSDDHFTGEFEYVSSRTIVLRIKGRDDFSGTPRISIITPSSAMEINTTELHVNVDTTKLESEWGPRKTLNSEDLLGRGLFRAPLRITTVRVADVDKKAGDVTIDISGDGISANTTLQVNGAMATEVARSGGARRVKFRPSGAAAWTLTATEAGPPALFASAAPSNPLLLKKTSGEVVVSMPAAGKAKEHLVVKLGAQSMDERIDAISVLGGIFDDSTQAMTPSEVVIEVDDPKDTVTVRLDRAIGDLRQTLFWTFERKRGQPATWIAR
jgi:hypothetical protein